MTHTLNLTCRCGAVKAKLIDVAPRTTNHLICHCDDCQAYARYLGDPDRLMDKAGGTRICQMSSAQIQLTTATEDLAIIRLSPKGLLRWYSRCCRSPLFNTLPTAGFPFAGLPADALSHPNGNEIGQAVGPLLGRVNLKFAVGDTSHIKSEERSLFSVLPRFIRIFGTARLRGDHKRGPFFGDNGKPIVPAEVIPLDEKARLYSS